MLFFKFFSRKIAVGAGGDVPKYVQLIDINKYVEKIHNVPFFISTINALELMVA